MSDLQLQSAADVFISYAREDREKAGAIAALLEQRGWRVWWDREIRIGDSFSDVITRELESAAAVVVLWSQHSVSSNWVRDEAQSGLDRARLVPALIENVNIPYGFRQIQAANLTDWDDTATHPEMARMLGDIARLLGRGSVIPERKITDKLPGATPRRGLLLGGLAILLALGIAAYQLIPGIPDPGPASRRDEAVAKCIEGLREAGQSQYKSAKTLYDESIRIYDKYPDAYFHRGETHVILQYIPEAVTDFKTYLALTSDQTVSTMRNQAGGYLAKLTSAPPVPVASTQSQGTVKPSVPVTTLTPKSTPLIKPAGTPLIKPAGTVPASTPTPVITGSGVPGPSPQPTGKGGKPVDRPTPIAAEVNKKVKAIFDDDDKKRVSATTQLIIEQRANAGAVRTAIDQARANPGNKSGVINALVFLQSADPALLKSQRKQLDELFTLVEKNGEQTREQITKVKARIQ
ncbi:MAG: TIR domain-containing protein [Blastocatellia bacterium]